MTDQFIIHFFFNAIYSPKDPIQVFKILILFIGVYIEVYKTKFARPKLAAIPLTP